MFQGHKHSFHLVGNPLSRYIIHRDKCQVYVPLESQRLHFNSSHSTIIMREIHCGGGREANFSLIDNNVMHTM